MTKPALTPTQQQKVVDLIDVHGLTRLAVASRFHVSERVICDTYHRLKRGSVMDALTSTDRLCAHRYCLSIAVPGERLCGYHAELMEEAS